MAEVDEIADLLPMNTNQEKNVSDIADLLPMNPYAKKEEPKGGFFSSFINHSIPGTPDYIPGTKPGLMGYYAHAMQEGTKDISRSTIGFGEGVAGALARGIENTGDDLPAEYSYLNPNALRGIADTLKSVGGSNSLQEDTTIKRPDGFGGYTYDVVRQAPQMAIQIGSGIAGGAPLSMGLMFSQIAGGDYKELTAKGVDPDRALQAGIANAVMQTPLEQFALGKFGNMFNGGGSIKKVGVSAASEFITEWMQEYPQDATAVWAKNPNMTIPQMAEKFLDNIGETTQNGMYAGAITAPYSLLGGAISSAGRSRRSAENPNTGPTTDQSDQTAGTNDLLAPELDSAINTPATQSTVLPVADNVENYSGVNDNIKQGANNFGSYLQSLGIDPIITSGKRSVENNTAVNGSATSHHLSGNAVDIGLGDITADQQAEIKAKAQEAGWGEVLYHDSGTGLHLHLADLQEGSQGSVASSANRENTLMAEAGDFKDIINEAAKTYGISPELIAAVMKQESGFNPNATSGVGAIGLMQLMPDTATELGVDPNDVRGNIMGGAKYLKQQLDTFGGDTQKALAAYNAGPGAVQEHNGIPPFAETQNYVKKIMGSLGNSKSTNVKSNTTISGMDALNELIEQQKFSSQQLNDINAWAQNKKEIETLPPDELNAINDSLDKGKNGLYEIANKYPIDIAKVFGLDAQVIDSTQEDNQTSPTNTTDRVINNTTTRDQINSASESNKPFMPETFYDDNEKLKQQQSLLDILGTVNAGKFDQAEQHLQNSANTNPVIANDIQASQQRENNQQKIDTEQRLANIIGQQPGSIELPNAQGLKVINDLKQSLGLTDSNIAPSNNLDNHIVDENILKTSEQIGNERRYTSLWNTQIKELSAAVNAKFKDYNQITLLANKLAEIAPLTGDNKKIQYANSKVDFYKKLIPAGSSIADVGPRETMTADDIKRSANFNNLNDIEKLFIDMLQHYNSNISVVENELLSEYNRIIKQYETILHSQVKQPGIKTVGENMSGDKFSRTYSGNYQWFMDLAKSHNYKNANNLPKYILERSIPEIALDHLRHGYIDNMYGEQLPEYESAKFNDLEVAINGIKQTRSKLESAIPNKLGQNERSSANDSGIIQERSQQAVAIGKQLGQSGEVERTELSRVVKLTEPVASEIPTSEDVSQEPGEKAVETISQESPIVEHDEVVGENLSNPIHDALKSANSGIETVRQFTDKHGKEVLTSLRKDKLINAPGGKVELTADGKVELAKLSEVTQTVEEDQPIHHPDLHIKEDIKNGDTVYHPKTGEPLTVTDASDKSMLAIENINGTKLNMGRKAVLTEKPTEKIETKQEEASIIKINNEAKPAEKQELVKPSISDNTEGFNADRAKNNFLNLVGKNKPAKKINLVDDSQSALDAAIKEALKDLNNISSNPMFNPKLMASVFRVGAIYIQRGVNNVKTWSEQMVDTLGEKIREFLPSVWESIHAWPSDHKYNDEIANAVFEYVGSQFQDGITDKETIRKSFVEFAGEEYSSLIDSAYAGVNEWPTFKKGVDDNAQRSDKSVERHGSDVSHNDKVGEQVLSNATGRIDRGNGQGSNKTGKEGDRPNGDQRIPLDGTNDSGATSNSGIRTGTSINSNSTAGSEQPAGSGNNSIERVSFDSTATTGVTKSATDRANAAALRVEQEKSDNIKIKVADLDNIKDTLPILFTEQHSDVHFIEQRHGKPDGYGALITNGTGTGKTFSGLGTIKRLVMQGKDNIIIVVPSDKIANDWISSGKLLGLDINQLADTKDAGNGVVVTSYANFGQNNSLVHRNWDMVVHDESHYLSSNEKGESTSSLFTLRKLTYHENGLWNRFNNVESKLVDEVESSYSAVESARNSDDQRDNQRVPELEEKAKKLNQMREKKRDEWFAKWKNIKPEDRPRVLFLSATPFAYVKNIDYAEGYLFNYPKKDGGSYNSGDGQQQFMMDKFGYSMRYNKLTRPDAKIDNGLMERNFHQYLRDEGALSGRVLNVDKDYDRKFILADDAIGAKIDEGLKWLNDELDGRYRPLSEAIMQNFKYHDRMYLLESIKARHSISLVNDYLAQGKKVVIFHDFNKGGGFHPFIMDEGALRYADQVSENGSGNGISLVELYREFKSKRPDIINMDLGDLNSPIATFKKEFGDDALFFNGTVSKKERLKNIDLFNDDNSGKDVILVQSDAGREGISLHDRTNEHQRVLINLGMPVKPTAAIQIEGRIYRVGQASDAIFRYLNTGTTFEQHTFASKIAERASTAENLALGEEARSLKDAYIDAYDLSGDYPVGMEGEGKGGKESDRSSRAALTQFDKAKSYYYGQQKKTSRNKAQEGADYYATPEPIGLKMVEWAKLGVDEKALEPSAGHGAISRFFSDNADHTIIEPSYELAPKAAMVSSAKLVTQKFEDYYVGNKFHGVIMNPPFGHGGATAIQHVSKAVKHLHNGGRVVALIPMGGMADKSFAKWYDSIDAENVYLVGEVKLPPSTFERAGTSVNTRIVILEKQNEKDKISKMQKDKYVDLSNAKDINELFDRIEDISMPDRQKNTEPKQEIKSQSINQMLGNDTDYALHQFKHSKTNDDIFIAKPSNNLGDAYKDVLAAAKRNDGWYNSYNGGDSVKGFAFKSEENRSKFLDSLPKEDTNNTNINFGFDPTFGKFNNRPDLLPELITKIKSLSNDIKAAMPGLVELGKQTIADGYTKSGEWSKKMRDHLGDSWSIFKPKIVDVWKLVRDTVANERGVIGKGEEPIVFKETVPDAGKIAPLDKLTRKLLGRTHEEILTDQELTNKFDQTVTKWYYNLNLKDKFQDQYHAEREVVQRGGLQNYVEQNAIHAREGQFGENRQIFGDVDAGRRSEIPTPVANRTRHSGLNRSDNNQGDSFYPKDGKKYNIDKKSTANNITINQLQQKFPTLKFTVIEEGYQYQATTPNGNIVEIKLNQDITPDYNSVLQAYGKEVADAVERGEMGALGVTEPVAITTKEGKLSFGAVVELAKKADLGTLDHETVHMVDMLGLIPDNAWKALGRKYDPKGKMSRAELEELVAEEYRKWNGQSNTVFSRIKKFFNDLYELVASPETISLYKSISDGSIFQQRSNMEQSDTSFSGELATGKYKYSIADIKKHFGFATSDNVSVVEKPKTGINPLRYFMQSAGRLAEINPKIKPFVREALKSEESNENMRNDFTHKMDKVMGLLKEKADLSSWTDIMWLGDALQKDFTNSELRQEGHNDNVIKAYRMARVAIDKAYNLANEIHQGIEIHTKNLTRGELSDLKSNPFISEIISENPSADGFHILTTYKAPKIREINGQTVTAQQLDEMNNDENIQVLKVRDMAGHVLPGAQTIVHGDSTYSVDYRQQKAPINKLKGYVSHIFHEWTIYRKDEQEDGTFKYVSEASESSIIKATQIANELADKLPDVEFVIKPKAFSMPGAAEASAVVGDNEYFRIIKELEDSYELSTADARELADHSVTMRNRGRFLNSKMHRTGAAGYEQNVEKVLRTHFNQVSRYVALDPFKRKAISLFEKYYGRFGDKHSGEADFVQGYINDVNGNPTNLEQTANDIIASMPIIGKMVSTFAIGRPSTALAGSIMKWTGIAKLGLPNIASSLINFSQLIGAGAKLNDFGALATGIQHTSNLSLTDRKVLRQAGVDANIGLASGAGYTDTKRFQGTATNFIMYPFSWSEKTIRKITVLGAYHQGIEKGMSSTEAINYAKKINSEVNFNYGMSDTPRFIRGGGPVTQVMFQFQKYPVKMLELMHDITTNGDLKQNMRFWLPTLSIAGYWGIPGFGLLVGPILGAILKNMFGFDGDDWEKVLKAATFKFAEGNKFLEAGVKASWYGGLSLGVGMDISKRSGIGEFGSITMMPKTGWEAAFKVLGAGGSTIYNSFVKSMEGDGVGAIKAISPGLGNVYAAIQGQQEGKRGRVKNEYETLYDRVVKGIGFRPITESIDSDIQLIINDARAKHREDQQKAIDDYIANPSSQKAINRVGELRITRQQIVNETKQKNMTNLERTNKNMSRQDKGKYYPLEQFGK